MTRFSQMTRFSFFARGSLLALAACGEASSQNAKIMDFCKSKMEVKDEACKCVAERAQKELLEEDRKILIAMISQDRDMMQELQGSVQPSAMMKVGMFAAMAPAECEQGLEKKQ